MYAYVLPYDLSSRHPDAHTVFLRQLQKHGLSAWTETSGQMLKLPNTTVTGKFASARDAEAALHAALQATKLELWASDVVLTKYFVIPQGKAGLVFSDVRQPTASTALANRFLNPPATMSALARLGQVRA